MILELDFCFPHTYIHTITLTTFSIERFTKKWKIKRWKKRLDHLFFVSVSTWDRTGLKSKDQKEKIIPSLEPRWAGVCGRDKGVLVQPEWYHKEYNICGKKIFSESSNLFHNLPYTVAARTQLQVAPTARVWKSFSRVYFSAKWSICCFDSQKCLLIIKIFLHINYHKNAYEHRWYVDLPNRFRSRLKALLSRLLLLLAACWCMWFRIAGLFRSSLRE